MNGDPLLLDTNIVLYYLNGEKSLFPVLEERQLYLSFITQLELLSFHGITGTETEAINGFFNECTIIDITSRIKELTIELRKKYRLKLPDAIVAASAQYLNIPLITADKGIRRINEIDLIFFQV